MRSRRQPLSDPRVRVALVAAAAIMIQTVMAKNVLDVRLDFVSQSAALWIFIVFMLTEQRDRIAELGFIAAIIGVTSATLIL